MTETKRLFHLGGTCSTDTPILKKIREDIGSKHGLEVIHIKGVASDGDDFFSLMFASGKDGANKQMEGFVKLFDDYINSFLKEHDVKCPEALKASPEYMSLFLDGLDQDKENFLTVKVSAYSRGCASAFLAAKYISEKYNGLFSWGFFFIDPADGPLHTMQNNILSHKASTFMMQ